MIDETKVGDAINQASDENKRRAIVTAISALLRLQNQNTPDGEIAEQALIKIFKLIAPKS